MPPSLLSNLRPAGPRRLARAALLGTLALAAACSHSPASAAERRGELLSATPASASRPTCLVESEPGALPAADAVVDSAALVSALRALAPGDPRPAHVLLSLAFDAQGTNIRREVIEHSSAPLVADSVQRLVFAARREVGEAEREWGVRLRVDLGETPAIRVGRREFCPPTARDLQLQRTMQTYQPAGVRFRRGMRERTVFMRAYVNAAGIITTAHIQRGEARGSSLEREIALHLRQFLFDPATIDGIPTGSWVEIPVRVRA